MTGKNNEGRLQAIGLETTLGQTKAIDGVSFSMQRGEIVAVVGRSGSGKSTLLHCLSGIITPDKGEVWYGNEALHSLSEPDRTRLRRTRFGVIFQFGQLVPELTALENVALPLLLAGARRRAGLAESHDRLADLGISHLSDRRPTTMSGGEAQRVALARALVMQPDIVFADEPTGALDSANAKVVLDLIQEAARKTDTGVLVVTHDDGVAAIADRVVCMQDGKMQQHALA